MGALSEAALSRFSLLPVSATSDAEAESRDSAVLREAFASHTADLLKTWIIPLESRADETITNVNLASSRIDFTVLRPGDVFSFNDVVGIRTVERGFRPGLMYANGEVVSGVGGGICIVSTALYNAALEAGLEIIERHPHSGPVTYADPGRDAAVSFGWADLCFRNTTGHMLYVRSTVADDKLVVSLFGTAVPGRTVEILSEDYEYLPCEVIEKVDPSVPEGQQIVSQKGRPGFRVTIVREIRQKGKLISREVMSRDTVLPRDKVLLVSKRTRDALPSSDGLEFELPPAQVLPLPDLPAPEAPVAPEQPSEADSQPSSPPVRLELGAGQNPR